MHLFIVDAETDGLYGGFLSVAALVTGEDGTEIDHFYGAVDVSKEEISSRWVRDNVYPMLTFAEKHFASEHELLEAFWLFWIKYREEAVCIADVGYPVEARLFMRCVMNDEKNREFLGPYPLIDLSSILLASGVDPNMDRQILAEVPLVRHDAMNDVRMTLSIWLKYGK